ncbi:MAG: type II toxin-antitoxin system HicA family toxin [Nitrospirae bacterium]|nr:type II toxin-antitoxin system HicA family toxin [Nitrospirota bacterium]MBI4838589.1 type II toxin-antitoxin system HicA family toxin [Nitrospirota bacterium]MBI5195098.1 type II toxin-antitoxin system HicA family toxin [Nitrospirota bacterium]
MSKTEKLFDKVKNNPQDIRFDEICKLAEIFGFRYKGGKGSHKVYSKKGITEILNFQNVRGKAKPYQVKQFLKIIEEHNLTIKEGQ